VESVKQLTGKAENLAEVRLGMERNSRRKGTETKDVQRYQCSGLSSGRQLLLQFTFPGGAPGDHPCGTPSVT